MVFECEAIFATEKNYHSVIISIGYSTMCGHAAIALGRYAVDYGIVTPTSPVTHLTLQCPCGPVRVKVQYENGKTGHVSFESVPAYVVATDQTVEVTGIGSVNYDIAYGGAFYAFVEADSIGLDLAKSPVKECVDRAGDITDKLRKTLSLTHHESQALAFLYGTILISATERQQLCIFAERQVRLFIALLIPSGIVLIIGRQITMWIWCHCKGCFRDT